MIYIKRAESCAVEAADCKVMMVAQGGKGRRRRKLGYSSYCETLTDSSDLGQNFCVLLLLL